MINDKTAKKFLLLFTVEYFNYTTYHGHNTF